MCKVDSNGSSWSFDSEVSKIFLVSERGFMA